MPEPCYIPSKMLIHCADVMQTDQNATAFGIHAKVGKHRLALHRPAGI